MALKGVRCLFIKGYQKEVLTQEIIEKTANNMCSMLQDVKKGRRTEINEINGILIQIGKKNNASTQLNSEYLKKIKSIS